MSNQLSFESTHTKAGQIFSRIPKTVAIVLRQFIFFLLLLVQTLRMPNVRLRIYLIKRSTLANIFKIKWSIAWCIKYNKILTKWTVRDSWKLEQSWNTICVTTTWLQDVCTIKQIFQDRNTFPCWARSMNYSRWEEQKGNFLKVSCKFCSRIQSPLWIWLIIYMYLHIKLTRFETSSTFLCHICYCCIVLKKKANNSSLSRQSLKKYLRLILAELWPFDSVYNLSASWNAFMLFFLCLLNSFLMQKIIK